MHVVYRALEHSTFTPRPTDLWNKNLFDKIDDVLYSININLNIILYLKGCILLSLFHCWDNIQILIQYITSPNKSYFILVYLLPS